MSKKIHIAIAEDHTMFRETLSNYLIEHGRFRMVIQASNGQDLLEQLKKKTVDIILLDLDMPIMDGRETLKILHVDHPQIGVIILSMHLSKGHVYKYISGGADAYLCKDGDPEMLINAIQSVYKQGIHIDENFTYEMLKEIVDEKFNPPQVVINDPLTAREQEILKLVCEELQNCEIGEKLGISPRTVENHRRTIKVKTGARNMIGLLRYAVQNKLIDLI
ncbi:MAG: response regulator transcription factor [Crocinitomicaceae bacterium]|nr:response regulator transcription factor [Crocinitomicaceae bacterium]